MLIPIKRSDIKTKEDYLLSLNIYINLKDNECDKKITKYNVELIRMCNDYIKLNKEITIKAYVINSLLLKSANISDINIKDINEVIKGNQEQNEIVLKLKDKLKLQSINKDWFAVLSHYIKGIEKDLITTNQTVLTVLEEFSGLSDYFKILIRDGVKPINDIMSNIYIAEDDNISEINKQKESIEAYTNNISLKINLYDIRRNARSNTTINKNSSYCGYMNNLNRYCSAFEKDMCSSSSQYATSGMSRIAGQLTMRLSNKTHNKEEKINSLREQCIIVLMQVEGKQNSNIKFVSMDTQQLNKLRKLSDISATSDYRRIKIYTSIDEANELVQMLNNNIYKYIGQVIILNNVADFLYYGQIRRERRETVSDYKRLLNIYNNKVNNKYKVSMKEVNALEKIHKKLCDIINMHNNKNTATNNTATVSIRRCAIIKESNEIALEIMVDYTRGNRQYEIGWYTINNLRNNLKLDKDTKYIISKFSRDFKEVLSLLAFSKSNID